MYVQYLSSLQRGARRCGRGYEKTIAGTIYIYSIFLARCDCAALKYAADLERRKSGR
jgi:hypothetical protein